VKLFIVAYDLHLPVKSYPALWAELERLGAVRVLASDWALRVNNTAHEVAEHFRKYMDADDSLLVTQPAAWAAYNLLVDLNEQQLAAR
jgi:hypothetical protein